MWISTTDACFRGVEKSDEEEDKFQVSDGLVVGSSSRVTAERPAIEKFHRRSRRQSASPSNLYLGILGTLSSFPSGSDVTYLFTDWLTEKEVEPHLFQSAVL